MNGRVVIDEKLSKRPTCRKITVGQWAADIACVEVTARPQMIVRPPRKYRKNIGPIIRPFGDETRYTEIKVAVGKRMEMFKFSTVADEKGNWRITFHDWMTGKIFADGEKDILSHIELLLNELSFSEIIELIPEHASMTLPSTLETIVEFPGITVRIEIPNHGKLNVNSRRNVYWNFEREGEITFFNSSHPKQRVVVRCRKDTRPDMTEVLHWFTAQGIRPEVALRIMETTNKLFRDVPITGGD